MRYPLAIQATREAGEEAVAVVENRIQELVAKVTRCTLDQEQQAYLLRFVYRKDFAGFNEEFAMLLPELRPT